MNEHLSLENLQMLKEALFGSEQELEGAVAELGHPAAGEVGAAALLHMQSADRNVRVAMLRLLAHFRSPNAMRGVLLGLNDRARRVRNVAIQSAKFFLEYPEICQRLKEMSTDLEEKRKIRERALTTLTGSGAPVLEGPLPPAAARELRALLPRSVYRSQILHGLVQLDPDDTVKELLREIVHIGTSEEVSIAEKALSGFKMVNIGHCKDEAQRRYVLQNCSVASGRVFYWLPTAGKKCLRSRANH